MHTVNLAISRSGFRCYRALRLSIEELQGGFGKVDIQSVFVVMARPKHKQVALKRAQEIQQAKGARLRLVAFCWNAMCEQSDVFSGHQRRAMKREILREREQWLRDQVRDAGLANAEVSIEVQWTADIASWVSENALEDVIVKSVHHSKTLTHTPLDWELLRQCPKPLLITAARRRKVSGNVLASIDLRSTNAQHRAMNLRVLEAASEFARIRNGKVQVVNVVEFSQVLRDLDIIDTRQVRKEAVAQSRELLDALLQPFGILRKSVHMPVGKVGQMVATTARKINADLLVVGTSARRGAQGFMLGNSAERILSKAPCDVLAVHP
jgi:universal stress protein E